MSKTEIPALAGEAVPLVQEVKQAVAGFAEAFTGAQDEIEQKLKHVETRMTKLERKSLTAARPHLAAADDAGAPHQKALTAYLRNGDDDALRGLDLEGKAMSAAVNSDGGYLVDPQTAETIRSVLQSSGSIRAVASVVSVEATSFDVLIDHSDVGAGWATEAGPQGETGTASIDRISIPLHELSALPKASQRLLDDSAFDIEGWLAGRIADKFARAESAAFISGDGADKPMGLLSHTIVHDDFWTWGELGYVHTGEAGGIGTGDAVIDLVYALGAQYRAKASFVMNSKTAGMIRKMKDGDGRFLWSDGLAAGEPARLLGYTVVICEDMPDPAADSYSVAFGDFGAGYTIAERPDLRVLRDPFSAKPHVLFYATKRVGGDVSDFAAIKLLKFGTA